MLFARVLSFANHLSCLSYSEFYVHPLLNVLWSENIGTDNFRCGVDLAQ